MTVVVLGVVAALVVVVIALVAVGREVGRLESRARPAVLQIEQAVAFIAEHLPADVAGRISHDDVRWVLGADADLLEEVTDEAIDPDEEDVVDEDAAVALILGRAGAERLDLTDDDIVAVLAARLAYLDEIGAIGPRASGSIDAAEGADGTEGDPGPSSA